MDKSEDKGQILSQLIDASREAILILRRSYRYSCPAEIDRLQSLIEKYDKANFREIYPDLEAVG